MSRRARLDSELVRRKLARSREHAAQLIGAGRVAVGGRTASKAATQVDTASAITVAEAAEGPDYVSRGAHKLIGALEAFGPKGLAVKERRCLDAGASTGASPTCCCATARRTCSPSTSGTASSPGRCGPTSGSRSWSGSTSGI
nr:hypothetical protein GCM10020093_030070 [Planobispora longispora]